MQCRSLANIKTEKWRWTSLALFHDEDLINCSSSIIHTYIHKRNIWCIQYMEKRKKSKRIQLHKLLIKSVSRRLYTYTCNLSNDKSDSSFFLPLSRCFFRLNLYKNNKLHVDFYSWENIWDGREFWRWFRCVHFFMSFLFEISKSCLIENTSRNFLGTKFLVNSKSLHFALLKIIST